MPEAVNPRAAWAAIEQRVEALAMQLLMNGEPAADSQSWSEAFTGLSEVAETLGRPDIATLAREAAGQVAAAPVEARGSTSSAECG